MNTQLTELEGTWEEIMEHAGELEGRRVKLIVLSSASQLANDLPENSAAAALMPFVGGWAGDDLPELLKDVYENRSRAQF